MNEIVIYQTPDNQTQVEVQFDKETVWLSQKQMAEIFGTEVPGINKHVKNIFHSGELRREGTISKMEIVRDEGKRKVKRTIEVYNLDMIISIGYRVNSERATQFRIWATNTLKSYLVKGYALNEKRLTQLTQNLQQLKNTVELISAGAKSEALQLQEAKGLLQIINNYTRSFVLLNQYDSNNFDSVNLSENITYEIKYKEAKIAIKELKKQLFAKEEATNLFGNEKDESFKSSLATITQTFRNQYLYHSIEEQAAHLLYFVIKNHSFTDGNKRIGAFLFIWFLDKNRHRFKQNGELKINDNGLTAIALLVAQSEPSEKELMIQLIINLISNT